jgi:hypothetical protein
MRVRFPSPAHRRCHCPCAARREKLSPGCWSHVHSEQEIRFEIHPFAAAAGSSFEVVSAPAVFLQAARFEDHFYIAGPGGLLEFDLRGTPSRQFIPGRELPASPLVALVPALLADSQESELVLATAQDGLLAFNAHGFRQIRPQNSEARAITSILPTTAGHVLIGTKKRGVLIYDGKHLAPLHPSRGFLDAANLSLDWIAGMQKRALVLEAHYTTHMEAIQLTREQSERILAGQSPRG